MTFRARPRVEIRVHELGAVDERVVARGGVEAGGEHRADRPAGRDSLPRMRNVADRARHRRHRAGSHARVSPATTSRRAKTTAFPAALRRAAPASRSNSGSVAGDARGRVRAKYRETIGALDELHRRRPARVDFDGVRNAIAGDEVDAVDADDAELLGDGAGERACRVHERLIARELRVACRGEDAAAISVSRRSEGVFADQLARHAERHRATAGRDEYHRTGRAVDELLPVTAARQARAAAPLTHPVPAAGRQRLHEPAAAPASLRRRALFGADGIADDDLRHGTRARA